MRNGVKPNSDVPSNLELPAIRRIGPEDLQDCATLSIDRGWWPEKSKWLILLQESDAWGIDAPDRPGLAGTVVLTQWGTERAAIGMMLVAERFGGRGLGRKLMEHAIGAAGKDVPISLFATNSGRPLYDKLGFQPVQRSTAFRGRFRATTKKGEAPTGTTGTIRTVTEADLPAILTLDRHAYGADRERMLSRWSDFTERFLVLEDDTGIIGYAGAWRTEAFLFIGPLMAPDGDSAKRLVTELAKDSPVAVRLDTNPDRPELPSWLRSCGLMAAEHTVMMTRGDQTPRGVPELLYAPTSVAMC
jgi:predicted N-acetyltransferase YhbS